MIQQVCLERLLYLIFSSVLEFNRQREARALHGVNHYDNENMVRDSNDNNAGLLSHHEHANAH